MAVLVDLEAMGDEELFDLAMLPVTSESGRRLCSLALDEWAQRWAQRPRRRRGRWDLLVWFTQQERIMTSDELDEALAHYRKGT
jgi:hypothetical protein